MGLILLTGWRAVAHRAGALATRAFGLLAAPVLLVGGGLCWHAAFALDPTQPLPQLHHTAWTTRDGGPGNVYGLAQTPDGILWIGTSAGLLRFDGVKFEHFAPAPGEAALREEISTVYSTPSGELWIGTRFGSAHVLRSGHLTSFGVRDGLPAHTIAGFARGSDGSMWAATTQGLFRLEGARWRLQPVDPAGPQRWGSLAFDVHGTLWIAGFPGTYFLPQGERRFRRLAEIRSSSRIVIDANGEAWIDHANGMLRLAGGRRVFDGRALGANTPDGSLSLMFDHHGDLWLGEDGGLARVAHDQLYESVRMPRPERSDKAERLSGAYVQVAFEDREGTIWIGTNSGLDRLRNTKLNLAGPGTALYNSAILPGPDNGVWAANNHHGLVRVGATVAPAHVLEPVGDTGGIYALHRDPRGVVWLGGWGAVLLRSAGTGFVPMPAVPFGGGGGYVQAVATDAAGGVWASIAPSGLWRFDGGRWERRAGPQGFPDEPPLAMHEDPTGAVWLGYVGGGVVRVVDGRAQAFDATEGPRIGNVMAICPVRAGIWFGGVGGVSLYRDGRFRMLRDLHGDSFTGVSGIAESADGDLWFNGMAGVTRVAASEIEAFIRDASYRVSTEVFNALDGLDGLPQQLGPLGTAATSLDGRVWFATTKSIYWIDPRRVRRNALPPPVSIRALDSDGLRRPPAQAVELARGSTRLHVEYAATSLTMPERVLFRYRLEGVDKTWQEAGTRREAWYTNLRPGNYRFRVIASNEDGVWNTDGATLDLTIPAAFYQTAWFFVLCALSCLVLAWAFFVMRLRRNAQEIRIRLEYRSRERERIARELHDTMLQGTQGLVLSFQVLADRLPRADVLRRDMEAVLDQADTVMAEARDAVMSLRRSASVAGELAQRLRAVGGEFGTGDDAAFVVKESGVAQPLGADVDEEVFRIVREALLNALRHAQAGTVVVQLAHRPGMLDIQVIDDGVGISPATMARGARPGHWGLPGMRERAEQIGARLAVHSSVGQGVRVSLQVPVERAAAPSRWSRAWHWLRWSSGRPD